MVVYLLSLCAIGAEKRTFYGRLRVSRTPSVAASFRNARCFVCLATGDATHASSWQIARGGDLFIDVFAGYLLKTQLLVPLTRFYASTSFRNVRCFSVVLTGGSANLSS